MKPHKRLLFVLAIFSFACVRAQAPVTAGTTTYLADYQGLKLNSLNNSWGDSELYLPEDAPGQKMIRVGKFLTLGGAVLFVGGVALMATADELFYQTSTSTYGGSQSEGDPQGALGVLLTSGGIGMIIPGAIVWSKGKKKYAAYKATGASLSLGMNKNGAGFRFRF